MLSAGQEIFRILSNQRRVPCFYEPKAGSSPERDESNLRPHNLSLTQKNVLFSKI